MEKSQKKRAKKKLPKLTENNYYDRASDLAYMSVSQYKSFMSCEARTMAKLNGEYGESGNNTALLVGSYVDAAIEGTLDKFKEEHTEIFKRDGNLKAEYVKAEEIVKKINADEVFMNFLSGDKQEIFTFNLFDVYWKIKLDSLVRGKCITDLKTARRTDGLPKWRYDIQGAVYQKGVELNKQGKLPFYLAVATKEEIPELNIFQIPQSTLDLALEEVQENLPHIMEVKNGRIQPTRCEKCDYCKLTKKTVIRNYNELLE